MSTLKNGNSARIKYDKGIQNEEKETSYYSIVEILFYLATRTSTDLCMATSLLDVHVEKLCQANLMAVKPVLRYSKGTKDCSIMLRPGRVNQMGAYIDSSWGLHHEMNCNRRSGILR